MRDHPVRNPNTEDAQQRAILMNRGTIQLLVICMIVCPGVFLVEIAAATDESQWQEVETKCVENRRRIESGRIVLNVRYPTHVNTPIRETISQQYSLLFDVENYRMDCRWTTPTSTKMYYKILTPTAYLSSGPPETPIHISKRGDRGLADVNIPNPRVLGMAPSGFEALGSYGLEDMLLRADRRFTSMTEIEHDGQQIWECRYSIGTEVDEHCTTWIAPTLGYSLLRYHSDGRHQDNRWSTELLVTPEFYPDASVWYPKEVTYRRVVNGQLVREELITVDSATFNMPISAEEFTTEGLNLPDGTEFLVNSQEMQIRDGRLNSATGISSVSAEERPISMLRYAFMAISLVVAAVAIFVFLRQRTADSGE